MMLAKVAFWGLITLEVVALIRSGPSGDDERDLVDLLDTLQQRSAGGEITEDEYLRARTTLRDPRQ